MPIKNNGYTHAKADAKQNKKRHEADIRQERYDLLTIAQKIARAEARSGSSKRELERLLNPKKKPAQAPTPVAVVEVKKEAKPRRQSKSEVVKMAKAKRPSKS